MDTIDWGAAQRIGEFVAGSPLFPASGRTPPSPSAPAQREGVAQEVAKLVSAYAGLELPERLPELEMVDRAGWIEANISSTKPLLEPVAQRLGKGSGPLPGTMRSITGLLLGAQVGAVTGMLSQRVLGQYDLTLLDPSVAPRLLLVAPNLKEAARTLQVGEEDLTCWVTIHEVTHAVQFAGVPWLQGHLASLLREPIDGLEVRVTLGQLMRVPSPGEIRALLLRLRRGDLLRLTFGEERWRLVERLQAAMSLIEGHAEHVMDAVGTEVLPSLPHLRAAMTRRRRDRGLPWRVLERLLGLELKLNQYELGRRFCDAVVAERGRQALTAAWRSPEQLPSMAELELPGLWLARTHVPPVTS